MKIVTLIFFFINLNFNIFFTKHPVHISVTNVDYNETENVFDLSIKLFADDFEKIISIKNNVVLNLGKKNENIQCNSLIDNYIKHHFILKINNKNLIKGIDLLKKDVKIDDNSVWLYYKLKYKKNKLVEGKKVEVVNILLNDLYKDQKNLFIFTYKNTKEGFNFGKNKINFEFLIR